MSPVALAQPASLAPTPSQPEGPFYPKKLPADHDGVLAGSPRGTLARLTMALTPEPGREACALAGAYEFVLP